MSLGQSHFFSEGCLNGHPCVSQRLRRSMNASLRASPRLLPCMMSRNSRNCSWQSGNPGGLSRSAHDVPRPTRAYLLAWQLFLVMFGCAVHWVKRMFKLNHGRNYF